MAVSAEALRTHLDYTAFASSRLVDAAANLSPSELTRDFQTADHSVLGTQLTSTPPTVSGSAASTATHPRNSSTPK